MNKTLTGIKPTGEFHLGNYVTLNAAQNATYLVADLHALNALPFEKVTEYRTDLIKALNALGYSPIVVQSETPKIMELYTYLLPLVSEGVLHRMHAYKASDGTPNMGLVTYPVLMTADIMASGCTHVAVGEDQIQHLELARDLVAKYNSHYKTSFAIPEAQIVSSTLVGTDGRKMSKSYGNTLPLFAPEAVIRKKIKLIKMDSRAPSEEKPDAEENIAYQILKAISPSVAADTITPLKEGRMGYGELKTVLTNTFFDLFGNARKIYGTT